MPGRAGSTVDVQPEGEHCEDGNGPSDGEAPRSRGRLVDYRYRRFLLFSALGGIAWAVYTCVLAYWIGTALADFALASIVISGIVTTVLIGGVYLIDRRRHASEETPATVA